MRILLKMKEPFLLLQMYHSRFVVLIRLKIFAVRKSLTTDIFIIIFNEHKLYPF